MIPIAFFHAQTGEPIGVPVWAPVLPAAGQLVLLPAGDEARVEAVVFDYGDPFRANVHVVPAIEETRKVPVGPHRLLG